MATDAALLAPPPTGRGHGLRYMPGVATLKIVQERCTGCGICLDVCPHRVLEVSGKLARVRDLDACMECGACARNCPSQAIDVRPGTGCAYLILKTMVGGLASCGDCGASSARGGEGAGVAGLGR